MPWSADDAAVCGKEAAGYHKRMVCNAGAPSPRRTPGTATGEHLGADAEDKSFRLCPVRTQCFSFKSQAVCGIYGKVTAQMMKPLAKSWLRYAILSIAEDFFYIKQQHRHRFFRADACIYKRYSIMSVKVYFFRFFLALRIAMMRFISL